MRGFQHDVPRFFLCCDRSSNFELLIYVESTQYPQDSFESQTLGSLCLRDRRFRSSHVSAKGSHSFLAVELEESSVQWTKKHTVRHPMHLAKMLLTLPSSVTPDKTAPKHAAWFSSLNKKI